MLSLEKIIISLLPIPVAYFIYQKYFTKNKYTIYLDAFLYGILQAAVMLLVFPWLDTLITDERKIFTGFFNAAFLEKLGAFLFLLVIFKRVYKELSILEYISFSMFFGIGFSALENIFYALETSTGMMLLRIFSTVPLHITTIGIMGYYLGLSNLHSNKLNKLFVTSQSFIIPTLFHGVYDTSLLYGEDKTYIIGPELAFLIVVLEYIIAKSISIPTKKELSEKIINLEDWNTIQLQPQYERWIINSMGKKNAEYVPFFRFQIDGKKLFSILLLIIVAILYFPFKTKILETFNLNISIEEQITIFVLYPSVFAFNLFLQGAINPDYFKNSIISIPIIMEVSIEEGLDSKSMVGSEVTMTNSFLKTFESIPIGHELLISYNYSKFRSPVIKGRVVWDNHEDFEQPLGSLIEFENKNFKFYLFILQYHLYKIFKGTLYNLKFPGFKKIRRLFVKEDTVVENHSYFTAGTTLFKEGEVGTTFYFLKKGNVEIYKELRNGGKLPLTMIEAGEIFGEMSILGNQPRAATAVCATNCVISTAQGDNLEALIKSNPDFSLKLIQTLAARLGNSERIMKRKIDELERELIEAREKNFELAEKFIQVDRKKHKK